MVRHDWVLDGNFARCLYCPRTVDLSDKAAAEARDETECLGRDAAPLTEEHFRIIADHPQVDGDVTGAVR